MTYKFYALKDDFKEIAKFIYDELSLSVFQGYSDFGHTLIEYCTATELITELETGQNPIQLSFWKKSFGFDYKTTKIDLNPKYCSGHTFRYRMDGWGLIHLNVGRLNWGRLEASSIAHNSEKRAITWESTNPEFGKVSDVNWEEVNKASRKLRYLIGKKLMATKFNGTDTLALAKEYLELAPA